MQDVPRNPTYIGHFRTDRRGSRPGNHEPITSRELFDKAQAQLESRRTVDANERKRQQFALRGKLPESNGFQTVGES